MRISKHISLPFIVGTLCILAAILLYSGAWLRPKPAALHQKFEQVLHQKETLLSQEIEQLKAALGDQYYPTIYVNNQHYQRLFEDQGLLLLVYENDTLSFWSDNAVPVDPILNRASFHSRIVRYKNGWYEIIKEDIGPLKVVGLILIKRAYQYQNNYLVNSFHEDYRLPTSVDVALAPSEDENTIAATSKDGTVLCYLKYPDKPAQSKAESIVIILLLLAGTLLLLKVINELFARLQSGIGPNKVALLLPAAVIALRGITFLTELPAVFYAFPIFDPNYYATSALFPSLGDLFLNVLVLFFVAYYIRKNLNFAAERLQNIPRPLAIFSGISILLLLFIISMGCDILVRGLIENSSISFDLNNLFELDFYSYSGLFIIGMMLFAYFLFADKLVSLLLQFQLAPRLLAITVLSGFALSFVLFLVSEGSLDFVKILWPLTIITLMIFVQSSLHQGYSFNYTILLLAIFSFFAAYSIIIYNSGKELQSRLIMAEKLAQEEDPIVEYLYQTVEPTLLSDQALIGYLTNLDDFDSENFNKRLDQQYFGSYFSKYDIKSYVFDSTGVPVYISDLNKKREDFRFFEDAIYEHGRSTRSGSLYFIENLGGRESYLLKLVVNDNQTLRPKSTVYIAFESKLIPEKIGFPELLLGKEARLYRKLSRYSFAKYRNNHLTYQYGKYSYSLSNAFQAKAPKVRNFEVINSEGFNHLIYQPNKRVSVVVSAVQEGMVGKATAFSYLFAFFSLVVLVFVLIRNLSAFPGSTLQKLNFHTKIQLLLVFVILSSLILFGIGTSYYINQQYREKNYTNIREKVQSVLIEVNNKLSDFDELTPTDVVYMNNILTKFSNVFFTDINLYDLNGALLSSSRPKLYNEGIVSKTMNARAFSRMTYDKKSEFTHEEEIGKLNYLSAYVPFRNKNGKLLAYLNLSYFAKQSEFEHEISSFLVALINIYVLLFALSVVAALIISNFITEPLRLIQRMLGAVELGKTNQAIRYEGKDEIGSLVAVYNKKVAELEQSAELLARSERESAWREMAKQVAHEIKNPLTPMKLNVQYLQRTWADDAPDWEEKLNRISQTLIDQIDTLSSIANEFSNFAQMPRAVNDKVDLRHNIGSVVDLFGETLDLKITFDPSSEPSIFVYADKDQLTRVFTNLLKNAKQAIPDGREGHINITLTVENQKAQVEIRDNGAGIPAEKIDKIFEPSFTTKSGGMGLGLAMVKNIVEGAEGAIWFETKLDEGTSFFVSLPLHEEGNASQQTASSNESV